jgi:hypothetical protein
MRRSSRTLGTDLWRELVEHLNEGLIVFNNRGLVIYANDEAAQLLDYQPRDVLGLDKEDFVTLCLKDRLDATRFEKAFLSPEPGQPQQSYDVVTFNKRLKLTPFVMELEFGQVTVLLLHEIENWRETLIARAVLTEMQSPLNFVSQYCDALNIRLESGDVDLYEIKDLTRIVQKGIGHAASLWEKVAWLYGTDSRHLPDLAMGPVALAEIVTEVIESWKKEISAPLTVELPADLPPVRASREHVHTALSTLAEGIITQLGHLERFEITAHNKQRYVQLEWTPVPINSRTRGYIFDSFPLAIAEQIVIQHHGRIWLEERDQDRRITTICISFPVWHGD